MAGILDRDHAPDNPLDEIKALRKDVENLKRIILAGTLGEYTASAPAATGYVTFTRIENGSPVTYQLLAATV